METGKFFFIITLVCVVAGIFTGVHHLQGVDEANAQLIEAKRKVKELRETMKVRQDEWAKIEAVGLKAKEAAAKEAPLVQELDELKVKFRRFEGDFKYLVKSVRSAVDKVRGEAVGEEYAEVKLSNGKVLKTAKIKKLDPMNVSFIHSDGFTIVPYDVLPDEIREKYDMGGNGLAEQLAAAEQTIQTAKFLPVEATGKRAGGTMDHVGVSGIQTMQGLSINCPIPLHSVAPPTPPGISQMMGWEAKDDSKGLEINVAVSDALEGSTPNLDGGVAGAVASLEKAGISNLTKSVMDLKVSDLPGKKCSISGLVQGQPIFFEIAIIIKAQRMYMVMAIFSNKDPQAREVANAILGSAKVE